MNKSSYKWWALLLLWIAFFLQQGTRQIFGATLPLIRESFNVSKTEIGVVATVFTLVYGICVPFAGVTADIFKRKWMVTIGVAIFCGGIFCSGFVASVGALLVTYGILNGLGQSFYYPSATSLLGQLHKESRATAFATLQYGLYAGIVGVSAIAGWCADQGADGWRKPFWIFGGVGLLWVLALIFFLQDTPPAASDGAAVKKATAGEAFKVLFVKPTAICVALGLVMQIYVDVGFKTWMPTFLKETYGCTMAQAALYAVLWHYLGAFFGVTIGSRLADKLVKARHGIRLETGIVGLLCAVPFIIYMAYAPTLTLCAVAMGLFGFFRGVYDSNLFASLFDVIEPRYHASATGVMLAVAFVFGSLSSTIIGWMFEKFSMNVGIASLGAFFFLGAVVLTLARTLFLKRDYCA